MNISLVDVVARLFAREMRQTTTRVLDTWPDAMKDLPAPDNIKNAILSRFGRLALVREVRPTMVPGHAPDSEPTGCRHCGKRPSLPYGGLPG
jgi:serine/threonine-protein kinase HipA